MKPLTHFDSAKSCRCNKGRALCGLAALGLSALACNGETLPIGELPGFGGTGADSRGGTSAGGGSAGTGNSSSGGATGGRSQSDTGGNASGGMGSAGEPGCPEQSPAGCVVNACPPSYTCDVSVGCKPSACTCTPEGWGCTADCAGGTCVPLDPPDSSACDALADELALQAPAAASLPTASCTAAVRLDYSTLAVLGHTFICGPAQQTDEASARAAADAAASFPNASPAGHGTARSVGGEWVFYQSPGDFGGAAAVSTRNGLTVFAGSIVWAGTGKVLAPMEWSTSDLGSGCPPTVTPISGIDLGSDFPFMNAEANGPAEVVLRSALPKALSKFGAVLDTVVLLYPKSVGSFDPKHAEYVVLLNGGKLAD